MTRSSKALIIVLTMRILFYFSLQNFHLSPIHNSHKILKATSTNKNKRMSHSIDSDEEIFYITLTKIPGSDLASKVLFREEEIKRIIVDDLTDHKINSTVYGIPNNEHEDGRKSDIIYTAKDQKHSERTPPLLVEVPKKVDLTFIKRLTRYCLSTHDVYKVKPIVAVFVFQGFASKAFRDSNFTKDKREPFYRCKQDLWSETCRFYSLDSISD